MSENHKAAQDGAGEKKKSKRTLSIGLSIAISVGIGAVVDIVLGVFGVGNILVSIAIGAVAAVVVLQIANRLFSHKAGKKQEDKGGD